MGKVNTLEERQNWIFTFGYGMKNAGHYVKIYGTYGEARNEMFRRYGDNWAFQYTEKQFNGNETELEVME